MSKKIKQQEFKTIDDIRAAVELALATPANNPELDGDLERAIDALKDHPSESAQQLGKHFWFLLQSCRNAGGSEARYSEELKRIAAMVSLINYSDI